MAVYPERGEIWLVSFDPSIGDEIKKTRPAVVVSSSRLSKLNLRLVVPITGWTPVFLHLPWHYRLEPSKENGLTKTSSADALQLKSISLIRFSQKIGKLSDVVVSEVICAIGMLIDSE